MHRVALPTTDVTTRPSIAPSAIERGAIVSSGVALLLAIGLAVLAAPTESLRAAMDRVPSDAGGPLAHPTLLEPMAAGAVALFVVFAIASMHRARSRRRLALDALARARVAATLALVGIAPLALAFVLGSDAVACALLGAAGASGLALAIAAYAVLPPAAIQARRALLITGTLAALGACYFASLAA